MQRLITGIFIVLISSCAIQHETISKKALSSKGMVVCAHPLATEAGLAILEDGGSAVDAAIATQLALAVVYPRAGNLAGGGFAILRNYEGEVKSLDFREKAPSASYKDMYLDKDGNAIQSLSREGGLAVGVPGSVAGMSTLHKTHGVLGWEELFKPAIKLAKRGFKITQNEADRLNKYKAEFVKWNDASIPFIKKEAWREGDILRLPNLAKTLKTISRKGAKAFYNGGIAQGIIESSSAKGGIMTSNDLKNYSTVWRAPIAIPYKEYTLYSMAPPSSGGIALGQILGMLEPFDLGHGDFTFQSTSTIHLMVEAERRAYADRASFLGDPDFVTVPQRDMLSKKYLTKRMSTFSEYEATKSKKIISGEFFELPESLETTHLSIVDKNGNAISLTTTLNGNYGSKVFNEEGGFFLNNEMDDFSAKPGVPNLYGLIGTEANSIQADKRMLSSMTPTIVEKNDALFLLLGSPGGSSIITTVAQVFLNVSDFNMDLSDAIAQLRFHHQWLPDQILIEKNCFDEERIKALNKMGHTFSEKKKIGQVDAIMIDENGIRIGGADSRGDDHAAGQ